MASVILPMILVPTVAKTVLVVDAILSRGGGSGLVARAAKTIRSQTSHAMSRQSLTTPRQRPNGPTSAGASKVRLVGRGSARLKVCRFLNLTLTTPRVLLMCTSNVDARY